MAGQASHYLETCASLSGVQFPEVYSMKGLEINELEKDMVFDGTLWRPLIHVADPT